MCSTLDSNAALYERHVIPTICLTCILQSLSFNCSEFADIFDVDWFISSLSKDVTIVKRIPDKVMRSMEKPPYTMRVPRKSTPEYYIQVALPILLRRRVCNKLFMS